MILDEDRIIKNEVLDIADSIDDIKQLSELQEIKMDLLLQII